MHSEMLTITPAEASKYLANNPANRRISETIVKAMAEDMKAGRWMETHQGIAISKTGRLLDGQHRLTAIIKAGIPVKMMVTFDVDEKAMDAIDQGRKRSTSDIFLFSGEETWMRDKCVIAAARFFINRTSNTAVSADKIRKLLNDNALAFNMFYKMRNTQKKSSVSIHSSVSAAVIAARINGVPEPDLIAFYDLYACDRLPGEGYNSEIVLRFKSYMIQNRTKHITPNRDELYRLASNVIYNFVKNTKSTLLRAPETERYVVSV